MDLQKQKETPKQKVMTLNAEQMFRYCEKNTSNVFMLDLTDYSLQKSVVEQTEDREDCPLFHQIYRAIEEMEELESGTLEITDKTIYDKLIIIDFDKVFRDDIYANNDLTKLIRNEKIENAQHLVENGLDILFEDGKDKIHFEAFDKSGSMSRTSRISFVADELDEFKLRENLDKRLNLGMDFTQIDYVDSKYYAYRGLYLSSSKRICHEDIDLNESTVVIIKDERMREYKDLKTGDVAEKPFTDRKYDWDIPSIGTAKVEKIAKVDDEREEIYWKFDEKDCSEDKKNKLPSLYVDIPFDGMGFISLTYAEKLNEALGISGATSFQIRMPFVKGMLHTVDVHEFLKKYNKHGNKEKLVYEDAFGCERDLNNAQIFITESMFKALKWIKQYLEKNNEEYESNDNDPMKFYFAKFEEFDHGLYISGTNLSYGKKDLTHLNYQVINTLKFEKKQQFDALIKKHRDYIKDPIKFIREYGVAEAEDNASLARTVIPNWKKAVLKNEKLRSDIYIKSQLQNIQKGLLTQLVEGKIIVEGQNRYLCRDLLPLLVSLLEKYEDAKDFYYTYLFTGFYMPMDGKDSKAEELELGHLSYYAFFRNPHLSRNEQALLRRFTETDEETYENNVHVTNVSYEKYMEFYKLYEKYFGKLTGIVMVPRGSAVPLILGGADFDGDLVKVIYNQEVVKAVAKGRTYEEESGKNKKGIKYKYYKRRLPVIKIPDYKDQNDNVNEKEQNNKDTSEKKDVRVPWSHIINTFSNKIGLISDTAISIGQKEYGRGNESEIEFASKEPSCAKCTLLTGLEIDAAKNGKHPNLDTILKKDIEKSSYISFLHNFKKLKGQSNYSIDRLKVKKEEPDIKYIEFYVTAEGTKARFKLTDDGTYINELPKVFKESLEEYKKAFTDNTRKNAKKVTHSFFEYPKNLSEKEKKAIEEYKKVCRSVLDYYRFYANIFLPRLRNEKEKNFYAPENIERNLFQIYDEETAMAIRQKVVPSICRKIKESVSNQNSIETMIERLEEEQWVLLPQKERDKALTRIIGNEVKPVAFEEEEIKFLCHFNQQGYKMLWLILSLAAGPQYKSFDTIKDTIEKGKPCSEGDNIKELDKSLENIVCDYYNNSAINTEAKIYKVCLSELMEISKSKELKRKLKISALCELTEESAQYRKFFWDTFWWDNLDKVIRKEKKDVK